MNRYLAYVSTIALGMVILAGAVISDVSNVEASDVVQTQINAAAKAYVLEKQAAATADANAESHNEMAAVHGHNAISAPSVTNAVSESVKAITNKAMATYNVAVREYHLSKSEARLDDIQEAIGAKIVAANDI